MSWFTDIGEWIGNTAGNIGSFFNDTYNSIYDVIKDPFGRTTSNKQFEKNYNLSSESLKLQEQNQQFNQDMATQQFNYQKYYDQNNLINQANQMKQLGINPALAGGATPVASSVSSAQAQGAGSVAGSSMPNNSSLMSILGSLIGSYNQLSGTKYTANSSASVQRDVAKMHMQEVEDTNQANKDIAETQASAMYGVQKLKDIQSSADRQLRETQDVLDRIETAKDLDIKNALKDIQNKSTDAQIEYLRQRAKNEKSEVKQGWFNSIINAIKSGYEIGSDIFGKLTVSKHPIGFGR